MDLKSACRCIFSVLISGAVFAAGCANRTNVKVHVPVSRILNLNQISSYSIRNDSNFGSVNAWEIEANYANDIFISDESRNILYKFSGKEGSVLEEGGIGREFGGFNRPLGISSDAALNLYVVDSGNNRIQILDRNLRFIARIDGYFNEKDEKLEFSELKDIEIDKEGNLWIADYDRILKLNPFSELLLEISYSAPINYNIGEITSLAVSDKDMVAIGDKGNGRIVVVSTYGNMISDFYTNSLHSITWDQDNALWAVNRTNGILSACDIYGNKLFSFSGDYPDSKIQCAAINSKGNVVVVDSFMKKVLFYDIVRGNS